MSLQPLTPSDVEAAFAARDLSINVHFYEDSTATSQQAADAIGCELGQIVKSLAFLVEGQPILVLASGDQRIDDRKIAEQYGVGRKKVSIATPEQCVEIYGYRPGGVPPYGHRTANLPTWIDRSLKRFDMLYAAAGAHNAIFPITPKDLVAVTGGTVADLVRETPAEG